MSVIRNPAELEESLGYSFADRGLLARALTHSSRANESPTPGSFPDNERLEFLGDSVLGWLVSEWLFGRFGDFTEGQLSLVKNHLVSAAHLLDVALRLRLGEHLQLGRGEESAGGRQKQRLLVNTFEAVLAAVYLDGGMEPARAIVIRLAIPDAEVLTQMAGAGPPQDYRAELDRLTRELDLPRPQYVLLGEGGPGHARIFTVEARVGRDIAFNGQGSSKKAASHNAAREVCRMLDPQSIA